MSGNSSVSTYGGQDASNELTTEQKHAAAPVGTASVPFHLIRSKSKSSSFIAFYDHLFNCSGDVSVSLTAPEAVYLSVSVMD